MKYRKQGSGFPCPHIVCLSADGVGVIDPVKMNERGIRLVEASGPGGRTDEKLLSISERITFIKITTCSSSCPQMKPVWYRKAVWFHRSACDMVFLDRTINTTVHGSGSQGEQKAFFLLQYHLFLCAAVWAKIWSQLFVYFLFDGCSSVS